MLNIVLIHPSGWKRSTECFEARDMFVCHPRKEEAAGTVNRLKVNWPCLFSSLAALPLSCCRVVPLIRFSLPSATRSSVWRRRESEEKECKEVPENQEGTGTQKRSWITESCGKCLKQDKEILCKDVKFGGFTSIFFSAVIKEENIC